MTKIKKICVYCGSGKGKKTLYQKAAAQLGTILAQNNIELIYGAGSIGLMAAIADAALAANGKVTGVIPEHFSKSVTHQSLTNIHTVENMHARKALMFELADAFIALPGGIGTLEEIIEVYTWSQLGLHTKPLALLNTAGYYDKLAEFLDHAVTEAFLSKPHREIIITAEKPQQLLKKLKKFTPPKQNNWWLKQNPATR